MREKCQFTAQLNPLFWLCQISVLLEIFSWSAEIFSHPVICNITYLSGVRALDSRRVLQRDHGATVDGLALREEVGVRLARRLFGRQPLQRGCVVRGRVGYRDLHAETGVECLRFP